MISIKKEWTDTPPGPLACTLPIRRLVEFLLRSSLDIRPQDRMEFWMTDEGMVLRKAEERCAVCGGVHGDMLDVDGMKFCRVCARKISTKLRTE